MGLNGAALRHKVPPLARPCWGDATQVIPQRQVSVLVFSPPAFISCLLVSSLLYQMLGGIRKCVLKREKYVGQKKYKVAKKKITLLRGSCD